ncbi:MAG: hypothetical protein AAF943_09385 [Pseudomonadota bacterium]
MSLKFNQLSTWADDRRSGFYVTFFERMLRCVVRPAESCLNLDQRGCSGRGQKPARRDIEKWHRRTSKLHRVHVRLMKRADMGCRGKGMHNAVGANMLMRDGGTGRINVYRDHTAANTEHRCACDGVVLLSLRRTHTAQYQQKRGYKMYEF